MTIIATIRTPKADYRFSHEGAVEKSTREGTWEYFGPVIGPVHAAVTTVQDRSRWYIRLWKYRREDVTEAFTWMKTATEISVHPTPIIASIAYDLIQCAFEKDKFTKEESHVQVI